MLAGACSIQHMQAMHKACHCLLLLLSRLQFQLSGESNSIKYDVTPQFFDCGMQPYDRAVERELFVNNTGKVRLLPSCC
jgi:hypothetical protein